MNDERMKILTMVSEGKITAEEAEKLMKKLEEQDNALEGRPAGTLPKYLYVRVDPKEGVQSEHGKVRVRVPLTLVRAGMNIASLMPKEVHDKIDGAMDEKGLNFKISDIDGKNIDDILLALRELEVDVDTEKEMVKVYCE